MAKEQDNELLKAALQYLSYGWSVIPLHHVLDNGKCSCGSEEPRHKPGKHPRIEWTEYQKKLPTEKEVTRWLKKWPKSNIGIVTGAMSGIIALDVDGERGVKTLRDGRYAVGITAISETGGGGWHYIYKHPGGDCRNFAGKTEKTILYKVDFRGDGGYIVAPPSNHLSGRNYQWAQPPQQTSVADAPQWLIDLIRKQTDVNNSQGKKLTQNDWSKDMPEGERNDHLTRLAGSLLKGLKIPIEQVLAMVKAINQGWSNPLSDNEVETIVKSIAKKEASKNKQHTDSAHSIGQTEPNGSVIQELNKKHAVLWVGGKCVVLNEIYDYALGRQDISFSTPTDFRSFYSNKFTSITDDNGNVKQVPWGKYWLSHPQRREYQGLVFVPGREVPDHFNLWSGHSVKAIEGDCSMILDFIETSICQGDRDRYNYIIAWLANLVQEPEKKPGTSIVMRGSQGTGKSFFAEKIIGNFFGSHFIHLQQAQHLVGHFNAHLKAALLIFADEAFWAGDKVAEGVLKTMVTEEYMTIEPKGKDAFTMRNYSRLIIASNNSWVVPAGLDERRFFVIDVGDNHKQDRKYFGELERFLDNGGREAFFYFLQNYDLSGIELGKFPQTAALMETKILSMDPVKKFWFSCLENGMQLEELDKWDESYISAKKFYDAFLQFSKNDAKKHKANEKEFGKELKMLIPVGDRGRFRRRPLLDMRREYAYVFPPLEVCRKYWEELTNTIGYKWPDSESEDIF